MTSLRRLFSIASIFIFIILIFGGAYFIQKRISFRPRAGGVNANILVDTRQALGPMPETARALAQGGEEPVRMLKAVLPEITELSPKLIRIDHIYDQYDVVRKNNGTISYDFSNLDATVADITSTGATPFLSLSYMPPALNADLTGYPNNWAEWENLIAATISHYSGHTARNLTGVYYEVWNEPDLFGRFIIGGEKDYRQLYYHSAIGATRVQNVNTFYLGGPAITSPIPSYLSGFLNYTASNNLRLDFVSWHRYSKNPDTYANDAKAVASLLAAYPQYAPMQKLVTEWNYDSEINPVHDSAYNGMYLLASYKRMIEGGIDFGFFFEIKDGVDPKGAQYWGRWGLLTHEQSGLAKKPAYAAFKLLSQLKGRRLQVTGEGSWVEAMAAAATDTTRILLYNKDPYGVHSEAVPLTINGLAPGNYRYKETTLSGDQKEETIEVTTSVATKTLNLLPNTAVLVELTKVTALGKFVVGQNGAPGNEALLLSPNSLPLVINSSGFSPASSVIQFAYQPTWNPTAAAAVELFSIKLANGQELKAQTMQLVGGPHLVFGVFNQGSPLDIAALPIKNWKAGEWHALTFYYTPDSLAIRIDGKSASSPRRTRAELGTVLVFGNSNGAIDNLLISDGNTILTERHFNGVVDR